MRRPLLLALALAPVSVSGAPAAQRGSDVRRVLPDARWTARELRPQRLRPLPGQVTRPDLLRGAATRPAILLTGYWPPSNEMLRRFSTNPLQNPLGWVGSDWEGRGYDVHAYFPEFPVPDCTSCGQGMGDLEVDYQDTSDDFWPIANGLAPLAVLTFSRGGANTSWEVEMNQYNRSTWIDDFTTPTQPTPSPPNQAAPAGSLLLSTQPVMQIVAALQAANLGVNPLICFSGDGGGYLSEFIAYHGAWYQDLHKDPADPAWCIAGGHVHVGAELDWATATLAAEQTVRTLIDYLDEVIEPGVCQPDLGFGGPGQAVLSACGDELLPGAELDLVLEGASPLALGWLVAGPNSAPTPFFGGQLVPVPAPVVQSLPTNPIGSFGLYNLTLPLPPGAKLFLQYAYLDTTLPGFFGLSNAVALEFL